MKHWLLRMWTPRGWTEVASGAVTDEDGGEAAMMAVRRTLIMNGKLIAITLSDPSRPRDPEFWTRSL